MAVMIMLMEVVVSQLSLIWINKNVEILMFVLVLGILFHVFLFVVLNLNFLE